MWLDAIELQRKLDALEDELEVDTLVQKIKSMTDAQVDARLNKFRQLAQVAEDEVRFRVVARSRGGK